MIIAAHSGKLFLLRKIPPIPRTITNQSHPSYNQLFIPSLSSKINPPMTIKAGPSSFLLLSLIRINPSESFHLEIVS